MSESPNVDPREDEQEDESSKKVTPLRVAIQILREGGELFHTPAREPYIYFPQDGHWETLRLGGSECRDWLARLFYRRTYRAPSESSVTEAISVLAGIAKFSGREQKAFVRVGEHDGCIYLDLANDNWQFVKISAQGWEVVSNPPIKFRRPRGMQALPLPVEGGQIDLLRPFLNIGSDDQWILAVSWLLGALRARGPYPILLLEGTQGSAKSTVTRVLRSLIDPNAAPTRFGPKDPRDLMIAALNGWCQGFDNMSRVPDWLADAFCRLATGGGYATRKNYSDDDEVLFEATRPILLNGIDLTISRGDLLDRTISLSLAAISSTDRQTEMEFWRRFERILPQVLGSLLTATSCALQRLPEVQIAQMPRMADFAKWVTAAEPALGWAEGTFLAAYRRNRQSSSELALEASLLLSPIQRLIAQDTWNGTATQLLSRLCESASNGEAIDRDWPKNPRELSACLHRLAPNLPNAGIEVDFGRTPGTGSAKTITLRRLVPRSCLDS